MAWEAMSTVPNDIVQPMSHSRNRPFGTGGREPRTTVEPAVPGRGHHRSCRICTCPEGGLSVSIGRSPMGSLGFTLADRAARSLFPARCRGVLAPGSPLAGSGKGLKLGGRSAPDPNDPSLGMCDPCREKFANLRDAERACSRPGCDGTWTWPAAAQLTAFATKQQPPTVPVRAAAREKLAALEDKTVPCSVAGCTRSSVFTQDGAAAGRGARRRGHSAATMRGPCDDVFEKLTYRQVTCGINGCKHKWTWTTDEQIQAYASGLPNEPPRRSATSARASSAPSPTARSVAAPQAARIPGPGAEVISWTPPRRQAGAQGAAPHVPALPRPLQQAQGRRAALPPARPASGPGPTSAAPSWPGRSAARPAIPILTTAPECEKELGELEDRQVPCKTDHCTGTWTWTSAQQLAAGVRPMPKDRAQGRQAGRGKGPRRGSRGGERCAGRGRRRQASEHEPASRRRPGRRPVARRPPAAADGNPCQGKARKDAGATASAGASRGRPRGAARRASSSSPIARPSRSPARGARRRYYWPPESQLQTHLGAWAVPSPARRLQARRDRSGRARLSARRCAT